MDILEIERLTDNGIRSTMPLCRDCHHKATVPGRWRAAPERSRRLRLCRNGMETIMPRRAYGPAVIAPICSIIPRSSRTTQCSAIRPSITR